MTLDLLRFRFKPPGKLRDDKLLIQKFGAGKYVERGELKLRPCVESHMTLGNNNDVTQTVRTELMKNVRHIGASSTGDCFYQGFPYALRVGKLGRIAFFKIDQRMPGERHVYC